MAGPARFERATLCLEGRCSIQLSYGPVRLFYQRKRNPKPNYAMHSPGEANRTHLQMVSTSGSFPKISDRACKGLHANASREQCFHVPNARQSETFCDIVLVIDAYRLSPTLDPEDALHPRRPA